MNSDMPFARDGSSSLFQLTLLTERRLFSLRLPASVDGQFSLAPDGRTVVSIAACSGKWLASGVSSMMYDSSNQLVSSAELHDGDYWYVFTPGGRQILMAESSGTGSNGYRRYTVPDGATVRIGRGAECDIRFKSPFVSQEHARLTCLNGAFRIEDADSKNGVFVNNVRVKSKDLRLGDVVNILTLKIIIGIGFIAINSEKNGVLVAGRTAEMFVPRFRDPARDEALEKGDGAGLFNRLPRRRLPTACRDINIEMPPLPLSADGIPLMLRMGGSAVYGTASLLAGNPIMLLSTVLFPLLSEKFTEKQRNEYEARRVAAYSGYLRQKAREIQSEKLREETTLRGNYPDTNTVLGYPLGGTKLWERRKSDGDLLSFRLGCGELPLEAEINYPEERLSLEHDELETQMYALAQQRVVLENVPILMDFLTHRLCGVGGTDRLRLEFVRRLIMHLAVLCSYDEVKLVVIARPDAVSQLGFINYLPHVWDDSKTIRFVVTNTSEAFLVGEYLAKELNEEAVKRPLPEILKERPYYFVISLDKQLQDRIEILKACCQDSGNRGVSIVCAFDDIPKECTALIGLSPTGMHSITDLADSEKEDVAFVFDPIDDSLVERSMRAVSNTILKTIGETYVLPKTLSFLEMLSVGRVAHLNILSRWESSNPVVSLAAPVGVDTSGNVFNLDIHQKHQGPHGLVAGMTGSGKSEFLLTYILSMAVSYHPHEVSFVLIDYKGGGLAGAFENEDKGIRLPHLAGTITNLDGPAIQRSLISLQSEVVRRQRIFNEAKVSLGESTMDIYSYQRYYREGRIADPVSHLIIISDEFAELKQQKPEFLDHLISIARIGRSLGIHLILATQKPSGVVNDQILSNTKFRVCLKVQTRGDSVDMLKRPDAAELQDTGRFFLQVGYNELFALGQSAWSGAPYIQREKALAKKDDRIRLVDAAGQDLLTVKRREEATVVQGTELTAVVAELSSVAQKNSICARQLWVPSLKKRYDLRDFQGAAGDGSALKVQCGMIDNPKEQAQYPLEIDLMSCGNILIAGAVGSGKTTMLQGLLIQLTKLHGPDEVNMYILDYSSRLLGVFRDLPHCGAVLTDDDDEYVNAFFDLVDGLISERKGLYSAHGIGNFEDARRMLGLPLVLVAIDNFTGLSSAKMGEKYAYNLADFLKRGAQYGIRWLVTCNHANEVNIRARQEIETRFALHAKDKYEYEEILGCRSSYVPPDFPGRGMCVSGGQALEMQVAIFEPELNSSERIEAVKSEIARIVADAPSGDTAKRLPVIDASITYDAFCSQQKRGTFPLGYYLENARPVALPLRQLTALSIYFGSPSSELPVLGNLMHFAAREDMRMVWVKSSEGSRIDALLASRRQAIPADGLRRCESTPQDIEELIREIVGEMQGRQAIWDAHRSGVGAAQKGDAFDYMRSATRPWLVLLENFGEICTLDGDITSALAGIMPLFHEFNMYAVGCFYPDDRYGLKNHALMSAFNPSDLVMLFGGRYSEQKCTDLPTDYARISSDGAFNKFLMKYRRKYYSVLMPCEEVVPESVREDDMPVFE